MRRLRDKLGAAAYETVRGMGYRFCEGDVLLDALLLILILALSAGHYYYVGGWYWRKQNCSVVVPAG